MWTPKTELAYRLDPVRFAEDLLDTELDPWQQQLLRSDSQHILLNCSRQSGKSTMTAALACWQALFEPGSLVLLLSPSLRQSQELFRKTLAIYRVTGRTVSPASETKLSLELANGSRVISLPGSESTTRGFSAVSLLAIDEAARVDDHLYISLRPMLAVSGGRLVALSTPYGTRGWWHAAWTSGEDWERYQIPASMCPRITPQFLAEGQASLGRRAYQQEYECAFAEAEDNVFRLEDIEACLGTVRKKGQYAVW